MRIATFQHCDYDNDDYNTNYSIYINSIKQSDGTHEYSLHIETFFAMYDYYYDTFGELISNFENKARAYLEYNPQMVENAVRMICMMMEFYVWSKNK